MISRPWYCMIIAS
jgi:hypothetical protein